MTYEYVCAACEHQWEAEQPISAAPLTACPSCHEEAARRQISGGAGFILKGGGWYADGYGKPSAKSDSVASKETNKSDSKSDSSKSDSKSDSSKSDAKPEPSTKSDPEAGKSSTKAITTNTSVVP
jgi:putative FmdB family regulatory protein